MDTFFSDTFGIDKKTVEDYGAFDVSLINDLPLFIDPFLLFHSEKEDYAKLHESIIEYLVFLRDRANDRHVSEGMLRNWYCFPEVKQNWFGFSLVGNSGSGLGIDFARSLHENLHVLFKDFGKEKITESSHLEKVCLISSGVGRDNISDFVTNLILDYLCSFTQDFCKKHLLDSQCKWVSIDRAVFNDRTQSWQRKGYRLPWANGDYIVLTPKDMLTRDDTWINSRDLYARFTEIPTAISDEGLRASVTNYFELELRSRAPKDDPPSKQDKVEATLATINRYPELIDYYIKLKEDSGDEATDLSFDKVLKTEIFFSEKLREILHPALKETDFYRTDFNTHEEAHARLAYLKHVIEDMGGWRIFHNDDGTTVTREKDVQILYRLVWFGTPSDVGTEANDGRGPVDFKVSRGREKTLIEMKLAKNTQLERNLKKQVEIYKSASDAQHGIKAIVYFSKRELDRVVRILKRLNLDDSKDIVLIDARKDNKPSASKA